MNGAKGPNPVVVGKIWDRVVEFQEEQSMTEKVYQPIVDHGEAHRVAIEKMTAAVAKQDAQAAQQYFFEAQYHEQMQRLAGQEARAYFLSKVRA